MQSLVITTLQLLLSGFVLIALLVIIFKFGWLWIMAQLNGTPVSLFKLMQMNADKVDASKIIRTAVLLRRAGINIDPLRLEAHSLAGGNISKVAEALIITHRAGQPINIEQLCEIDLSGCDVCAEVKKAVAQASTQAN